MIPDNDFNNLPKQASRRIGWLVGGILLSLLVAGAGFWLLTSTAKPQVVSVTMPAARQAGPPEVVPTEALTIIPAANQRYYYYFGPNPATIPPVLHVANSSQEMRKALLGWQRHTKSTVFIKPGSHSKYQDMVTILDEMNITDQKKYSLTDLTAADRQLLPASERQ